MIQHNTKLKDTMLKQVGQNNRKEPNVYGKKLQQQQLKFKAWSLNNDVSFPAFCK